MSDRFIDNKDGTVTDSVTRLVWLKIAHVRCVDAVHWVSDVANGTHGLSDGSHRGDWQLPTIKEFNSITDYSRYAPALPYERAYALLA